MERRDALSTAPLSYREGGGLVVVFRYGVMVTVNLSAEAQKAALAAILPRVASPSDEQESETIRLALRDDGGSTRRSVEIAFDTLGIAT